MKYFLLLAITFVFCLRLSAQSPPSNRSLVQFKNLYEATNGDDWTISDKATLLSRKTNPFIVTRDVGAYDSDFKNVREVDGHPSGMTRYVEYNLENNNLTGSLTNDFWYVDNYEGNEIEDHYLAQSANKSYVRLSHNSLSSAEGLNLGKSTLGKQYIQEVTLDNNLIEEITFGTNISGTVGRGLFVLTLHQNEISHMTANDLGVRNNNAIIGNSAKVFRIDNNRLNFASLISTHDAVRYITKYHSYNVPGNSDFLFDYAPQKPLGGDETATTVAKGTTQSLSFTMDHPDNVYSWQLNGVDLPSSITKNYQTVINEHTAGVYRCKVTNPNLPGVELFSYDMAVYMEKAGNKAITDFVLSTNTITAFFPENSILGSFSGNDPDGDAVFYRLQDKTADNSHFRILNGKSLISSEILFEKDYITEYKIIVQAYDKFGGVTDKEFTITKGESTGTPIPTSIELDINTVNENEANATIGLISAPGTDPSHGYTFSLPLGTDDNNLFKIEGAALKTKDALNYEAKNLYNIQIKATATDGTNIQMPFTIKVLDQNDAPTKIGITNSQILTNNIAGVILGQLFATDEDSKSFTYALAKGYNDNINFVVTNNLVTVKTIFTEAKSLTLGITVIDDTNLSLTQELPISVTEEGVINLAPRQIGLTNTVITSDMKVGGKISDLVLSDPDGDIGTFICENDYIEAVGATLRLKEMPGDINNFTIQVIANDGDNDLMKEFKIWVAKEEGTTDGVYVFGSDVVLHPNPAQTNIMVSGAPDATYSIVGLNGQVVKKSNNPNLYISDLNNGVYLIKIDDGEKVVTKKFVKN